MTLLAPHALWLLLLGPIVWWLVRRRQTHGECTVPHLPVLESVLNARDLTPIAPPWRALLLVLALILAAIAAADPRPLVPAPRRLVLLAWDHPDAIARAQRLAREDLAEDDVRLTRVRPGGIETLAEPTRDTDHRAAPSHHARMAAAAAAGPEGFVLPIGAPAPPPADPDAERAPEPRAPEAPDAPEAPMPRRALVVTRGNAPVPRWLAAALAAMPDLVADAGAVQLADLELALREMPEAFVVAIGIGPGRLPSADWLCIAPPIGDPELALESLGSTGIAIGIRFSGDHPISRGLSAAGIELDSHLAPKPDSRYLPLLQTDRGVAAVAGAPSPQGRCVAVLGDPGRAFARYPAWPRFMRRAVTWLATERAAQQTLRLRAGGAELDGSDGGELQLPAWRGRTRGAVRLPPGFHPIGNGRRVALESDPFAPDRDTAPPAPPLPPRTPEPAPLGPAPWLALAALGALALATIRL